MGKDIAARLGSAYRHMESVSNAVVYRTSRFEKEPNNDFLWNRVASAEEAYDGAKRELADAFADVFIGNGMDADAAIDAAAAAADSAAYALRMAAWEDLGRTA